jgi:hypothetical protein
VEAILGAESKLGEMLAAIPKPKFNKRINGSKERTTGKTLPPTLHRRLPRIQRRLEIRKYLICGWLAILRRKLRRLVMSPKKQSVKYVRKWQNCQNLTNRR